MIISTFASGEAVSDSKDKRPHVLPRFMEANRVKNVNPVSHFKALADKQGCTMAQLAFAGLLKQGDEVVPTPGTKKLEYLEEEWSALDVHLTDEDEAEIRQFVETAELAGPSMPPQFESYSFRDTEEEV